MSRASHHRAGKAPRRRRTLHLTAAVATLLGSAAIAIGYAHSRGPDTAEATERPAASRLDVLDPEDEPGASASPDEGPTRFRPPAGIEGTVPSASVHDRVGDQAGTPSSASASATSASTSAAPASSPAHGGPSAEPTTPAPPPSTPEPTLRRHDRGPEVVELQQRLGQLGLWSLPQRGRFDRHLHIAVQRFQRDHDVRDDEPGVYGPATRRLLESMTS
ncbi:peptidoglycan-binding domain-containing protein [Streptomyces lavendulocolor]|uniref:peptidoglycan-binding domain-containing protein n=1 Tax=Streptomyces lavendulocolor TaxID=67316 RepID=UPI003400791D